MEKKAEQLFKFNFESEFDKKLVIGIIDKNVDLKTDKKLKSNDPTMTNINEQSYSEIANDKGGYIMAAEDSIDQQVSERIKGFE